MADIWEDFEQWRSPYWSSSIVKNQFDIAQAYADSVWNVAFEATQELFDEFFTFTPSAIEHQPYVVNPPEVTVDIDTPEIDSSVEQVVKPTSPILEGYAPVEPVEIPTFNEEVTINIPDIPDVTFPDEPGDAPDIRDQVFPAPPDIELPPVPVLDDIVLPEVPPITRPGLDAEKPVLTVEPPVVTFMYSEEIYDSALGNALDDRLLQEVLSDRTMLSDGTITFGSGIPSAVETAIYERHLDRMQDQVFADYQEVEGYFAARNHELPPGAMSGRLLELNKASTRQRLDHNNTVMIQAFEVAQKNNQFIISAGLQREEALLQYSNSVAQRAFDAAKYLQDAAILVFQAKLTKFQVEVEAYKAELAVYETKIRAELLFLEAYRIELEGAKVKSELNQAEVQLYMARIGAVGAQISLFNAQLDSVKANIAIDAERIRAFGEKVRAYATQVGAATARYDAYTAQIAGEKAKADVYDSLVRAFTAKVEGARTRAQINDIQARQVIETNRALIDKYTADINAYGEEIRAIVASGQLEAIIYESAVRAILARAEVLKSNNELNIQAQATTINSLNAYTDRALKEAEINIQGAIQTNALNLEARKAGATASAQLAASSLSSIHASAAISHSGNRSRSVDETKSDVSRSISLSGPYTGAQF